MIKNVLKKIAVVMVLVMFVIPCSSFVIPSYEKKVQANEVIDAVFFSAVLACIGGTALLGLNISDNFNIPTVDFNNLKENMQTGLLNDPVKSQAWFKMQSDYLVNGSLSAVTASQLASAGVNDVYNNFISYLHNY